MLALFKSHYSIGKSILTLNDASKVKDGGSDSIFQIALDNNLSEIILVEDSLIGFSEAYKRCTENNIKLVFGLRLSMRNSQEEADTESEHKIIIFAKNNQGCKLLNLIYSKAFTESNGYLTYETLEKVWDDTHLKLAVPFYDSFLYTNLLKYGTNSIPNFNKIKPTFFIESNGLAFDSLLKDEVVEYASKNNCPTEKVKSIYYKNKKDAEALMSYKIICNRSFGKTRSLSRPELAHFCSNEFSFESWKEQNA
jgi:DNA polymerase III alpha subunit|tara:strand:- start:1378 stop:2133 length:756 start_codon:yes stop_codon:yes gene_type:complete